MECRRHPTRFSQSRKHSSNLDCLRCLITSREQAPSLELERRTTMSRIWQSPSPPQPASSADRPRSSPSYPGGTSVFASQYAWQHMTVPGLFSVQAALTPLAPAIVFEDQTFSYVDLEESANQLAHYLRRQGLQPDQWVALFWEQG